ncbi:GvpL/GvpF family gas vesicle protein [Actinophytocola glycyrrhizae]|uniref:GvpL/GvpF family gas vesicle protein n=1 Tax=Actinophytocola glycyrrhizae TaxID=2044873 RepID=A0ABV9RUM6_9PSEU
MPEHGTWVYVVVEGVEPNLLTGMTGVAGEPVRTTGANGLTAVVGTVPLAAFGEDALHRNLEDIDWLARVAQAHDAVVAAVARAVPAVPFRMATVYFDDDRVGSLLEDRGDGFRAALSRVDGRSEWGVKALLDVNELSEAAPAEASDRRGSGAGAAYLRRKREHHLLRERIDELAVEHADEIHATLTALAVDACLHRPQSPALSQQKSPGGDSRTPGILPMILNAAYLVDNGAVEEFAHEVGRQDERRPGVELELTGPWPAYSFSSIGLEP